MENNPIELLSKYIPMTEEELSAELKELQSKTFSDYDVDGNKGKNLAAQKMIQSILNDRRGTTSTDNTSQYGTNANYQPQAYMEPSNVDQGSSMDGGQVALGVVMLLAGIGLSMAMEGSIFYGLMIVGVITIVKGLMG